MKKIMTKGLLSILLISVLSIALWGCGSTKEDDAAATNSASAAESVKPTDAITSTAPTDTAAPTVAPAANDGKVVELTFSYWGSTYEKKAIDKMLESFNASHPGIHVKPLYIPGDYGTKINTLMAAGGLPDVGYLDTPLALKWGKEGKLLDFTPYLKQFPQLEDRIPQAKLYPAPGVYIGSTLASDSLNLFYNKDLFTEAGLDLPPSKAENAWTWDQFLLVAQKLTKDKNGKNATEAGFDSKNIVQYGFDFPNGSGGWFPYILSNGSDIASADGKTYTLNSPESIQAFQNLQDLVYKYHVSPTPTTKKNAPGTEVQLQTKKVAMIQDGMWKLLDLASTKLNYGIGVLPKYKEPKTGVVGASGVIFSSTKHPVEALEFYSYYNDPAQVDLYSVGLWMPIETKYFTEQASIDLWTKNASHPAEFNDAVVNYQFKNGVAMPTNSLIGYLEIGTLIDSALDDIWTNKKPAKEVLDALAPKVQPLLQGRYTQN
ncbi:sugar ABC transporter substrate-binding protein [Paenibacillus psychroresistens]|uniref:Sugar ABC transporter substrate-binding protein n=1 Tax=Paenibacillus psychroresistens TaxID=1778678 RepID=A0A6B8RHJ7_9BACL|nr:sugar ABC transporter substrate-binding protein [Paenibacillus psychroresistens]QGQ95075.1 sugar ABC transporter substrate-binding protein [Paenibacillus psychroresistens]